MKRFDFSGLASLRREVRVGALAAIMIALGAIALGRGWDTAGIVLFVIVAALLVAFYALVVRPARIPAEAVLSLRIAANLREDAPRSALEQLRGRGAPTFFQIRRALQAAATDPSIKGVIVEVATPGSGLATAQELHDLLRAVVAAGKRVVAVIAGDSVTVRDYLIASGAGEVVVNPDSALMMLGVAVGGLFLKNALGKLRIEAQTSQWKEYKGAAETFSREAMSPEVRESLEAILGDWKTMLVEKIAVARKLEPARATALLAHGFMGARAAREAGLIDRAGYLEEIRDEFDPGDRSEKFIMIGRYLRHVDWLQEGGRRARFALIHAIGPVITGEPPFAGEFISGERTADEVRRAARDKNVRAIIFRVNSPGGSAVGSDLVWRAVGEARKRGKPVVVSMGDVAGSGGYYVAMGADAIVAESSTITGSIGVVYTKFSAGKLLAHLGIGIEGVKSDAIGDALSPARTLSAAEFAQVNEMVGELYANFTAKVAEGRKLSPEAAEAVARGRVWSGAAARAHGLIDELGGLGRAVAIAREKTGLAADQNHELVPYPSATIFSALNNLLMRAEMPAPLGPLSELLEIPSRWTPAFLRMMLRGGLMLLCPFF